MNWTTWPLNAYAGMVVRVTYELKFKSGKENIPPGTKGLVIQQCWFESKDGGPEYEVYHVHFPNYGSVFVATDDLDIVE